MKNILLATLMFVSVNADNLAMPKSWKRGITVVQYNAGFNKSNSIENLTKLADAKVYDAWIDQDPEMKETGRIKSVPTIIIYNNGKEVRRWEAGLMMKLDISYHEIQKFIDELTGADKF
tara:strand:- start:356 stop:712 length:357 start_codon:yes stop_codon:yes gene_type:complete